MFVIVGPGVAKVRGHHRHRAGVCGTDVEFYTGEMSLLHTGQAGADHLQRLHG